MKKCLTCNNMVPDGRVLSKCDGCLALYYYGDALDRLVNLLDPSTARADFTVRNQALNIVLKALKAVPRRKEEQDEAQG